jgi:(heptosyl)LPS beta-1,4-glucosyltransferase
MTHLTAVVLTFNEQRNIGACIESLRFADSILVFDSLSTDHTAQLAKAAGAEVILHRFEDYAQQRNAALDAVTDRADYVLFVDADERVTPELVDEIRLAITSQPEAAGWRIPRHNYIFGRLTRHAGWYPDYQTRLLKVGAARFDPERKVHEVVQLDGPLGTLQEHFIHYNYDNVDQFLAKQRTYTAYEAQIMFDEGIRPKLQNYILQPLRHFRWRFLELEGYRDGFHGFRLSLLMAWYELKKYLALRRLWKTGE